VHYECVRRNLRFAEQYAGLSEHPFGADLAASLLSSEWRILDGDELPNPRERPPLDQALSRSMPKELGSWRPGLSLPDPRVSRAMTSAPFPDIGSDRAAVAGMLMLTYFPEEDSDHPTMRVFDARWSKRDLLEAFEGWVDRAIADRAAAGLRQERPPQRIRLDEYPHYLKAYDLRSERKKFKEIGKVLWPGFDGDLGKRARDYYQRGRTLVLSPPLAPKRKQRDQKPRLE